MTTYVYGNTPSAHRLRISCSHSETGTKWSVILTEHWQRFEGQFRVWCWSAE